MICATGRCWLQIDVGAEDWRPLRWDDGPPWQFALALQADQGSNGYAVTGWLERGEAKMDMAAPLFLSAGGVLLIEDTFARLDDSGAFPWIAHLREQGPLRVRATQADDLLARLFRLPRLPRLEVPEALRFEEVAGSPQPRLRIRPGPRDWGRAGSSVSPFDYAGTLAPAGEPSLGGFDAQQRRLIRRDAAAEQAAADRLAEMGWRPRSFWGREGYQMGLELAPRKLPNVVVQLVREGWHVEAEGKLYRRPGDSSSRSSPASTGSSCTARSTSATGGARCPSCSPPSAQATGRSALDDGTLRPAARGVARRSTAGSPALGTARGRSPPLHRSARSASSTRCSSSLPEARGRRRLRPRARRAAALRRHRARRRPPPASRARLRPYQRDGLGWLDFLASSASAAASPTTWGWARRCRCSRCSTRAARGEGARPVARRRAAVAGLQLEARGARSRRSCACSTTPAPAASTPARALRRRTTWSSRPTARCGATRRCSRTWRSTT